MKFNSNTQTWRARIKTSMSSESRQPNGNNSFDKSKVFVNKLAEKELFCLVLRRRVTRSITCDKQIRRDSKTVVCVAAFKAFQSVVKMLSVPWSGRKELPVLASGKRTEVLTLSQECATRWSQMGIFFSPYSFNWFQGSASKIWQIGDQFTIVRLQMKVSSVLLQSLQFLPPKENTSH